MFVKEREYNLTGSAAITWAIDSPGTKIYFYNLIVTIIPPRQRSCFHLVRPSVRLWTESCPFCILPNTSRIHFICTHLIKQIEKVCRVQGLLWNFKNWSSGIFFQFVNLTLSCFDLGSNMNAMGNHGAAEVSSERRRSSYSSLGLVWF